MKQRLDELLVARGLSPTRAQAKALIMSGRVRHGTDRLDKPGKDYPADFEISVDQPPRFVSRGGEKLAAFLEKFPVDFTGKHVLDVGASTGGFTEVLLAGGASLVYAIDVGTAQLHPSLRGNPKIVSMENTDVRSLTGKRLEIRPDIVVIDVSFISLKLVLPAILPLAASPMHLLALIKPQFEADRKLAKKGIVRDEAVHRAVCDDIAQFAASLGCTNIEVFPSAILGGDGNREFFIGARRG
jgi:23S rRNA (cytidine1920-2'-O)/16S rRNA (cytidine1409-2'-O)-methyltransferase